MKLKEILSKVKDIEKQYKTSSVYICGGVVRDKYMKRLENVNDLDLTTGDQSIKIISDKLGETLASKYKIIQRTMEDGHSSIKLGNLKLDFSSNYIVPDIDNILFKLNVKNITNLSREMFSRDFTCNSLLLNLDLNQITSPVATSLIDIDNKLLKTCLPANITLVSSKNRVVRAIYLASKLSFNIDKSIIDFVKQNPNTINISNPHTVEKKLNEAFEYDSDRAVWNINQMNLWDYIPITEKISPFYAKKFRGQNA